MDGYHETGLSQEAQDIHRAIISLVEELIAVDAYNQRADVSDEQLLVSTLLHNRDEEIEHSAMLLEWLRRKIPKFDEELRQYLFTSGDIASIEETATGGDAEGETPSAGSSDLGIGRLE